jgi:hypothetical protein
MASTLFVQMESRLRRRSMIDLIDILNIEARMQAGVQYITLPEPGRIPAWSEMPSPVPAKLLNSALQASQSGSQGSESAAH